MIPTNAPPVCDAFTIASSNRLRAATALATSYLQTHPGQQFVVILVTDDVLPETPMSGLSYLRHTAIPVPEPDVFPFRLPPEQLAHALVPHAFAHLLGLEIGAHLIYLAHDGWVYRPLNALMAALDRHEIVLAPALRTVGRCIEDSFIEHRLFSHGAYGDGLIGIRRGATTSRFLKWWALARDAIDIEGEHPPARALDAVPALFPDTTGILGHPGYHVSRWNLHERRLALDGETPTVDGQALGFMRFDGVDATGDDGRPTQAGVLARLLARYALAVDAVQVCDTPMPDCLLRLDNGVRVSRALNRIVSTCVRRGIPLPAPGRDADAFCAFASRPDPLVFGQWVAPVATAVLMDRPDVAAAFPEAARTPACPGFSAWLASNGGTEEHLKTLVQRFGGAMVRDNGVRVALAVYAARPVLREIYPAIFEDPACHAAYGEWLVAENAAGRIGFDAGHLADYRRAEGGIARVLDAYFGDPHLLARLPMPCTDAVIAALVAHLAAALPGYPMIDGTDLLWFAEGARHVRFELLLAALRYGPVCRDAIGGLPSLPAMPAIADFLAAQGVDAEMIARVAATLAAGDWIDPASQYAAFVASDADTSRLFPLGHPDLLARDRAHYVIDRSGTHAFGADGARWCARVLACVDPDVPRRGVNLCGPIDDASGIGEATRGLRRALDAAGIACSLYRLPARQRNQTSRPALRELYGAFDEQLSVNLTVGNAAGRRHLDFWLPRHLARDHANVGTWVWETETLPEHFREAADGLDLIISPSRYAATAIAATVDVPVHVVPNALDAQALSNARADRARFGLPADALLLGFFFDTDSVIERKHPAGLLQAFRRAFGSRRDVALVLKVNTRTPSDARYQRLKLQASDLNVIWLQETLTSSETLSLMASLDAYVSLHRAEGFGLTLAEAMALGKPVVATGYSGNTDFMDAEHALLVEFETCVSEHPHGPYPAGSRWSDPDIAHAATQLRRLQDPVLRARLGRAGQEHVTTILDIRRIAAALEQALSPWLAPSPTSPRHGGIVDRIRQNGRPL